MNIVGGKHMKRVIPMILACIVAAFLIVSCGHDDASLPTTSQTTNQMNQTSQLGAPPSSLSPAQGQGGDHHCEQIIMSGEGTCGSIGEFGFWVWSQDPECNTPYAGEAAGSISLQDQKLTTGVEGEVTEPVDGTYVIEVDSRPEDTSGPITATLTFSGEPEHGPHNTVTVHFTSPEDCTVEVTDAVVHVTGPEE
jgi:hypothetical protein